MSDIINIQDYVSLDRTGKAGLRVASMSEGLSSVSLDSTAHSTPNFSTTDVGKNIVVIGAGADDTPFYLFTSISTVLGPTQVELPVPAAVSVSRAAVAWWDASQDDTAAFNSAQKDCTAGNGVLYCPGDVYIISSPLIALRNLQSIIGDGARETFFVCTPSLTGTFLSVPDVPSWFSLGGAPTQGFTILGPGFQTPPTVTAWSITSGVATFIANNNFQAGQEILLQGFTGKSNSTVNNQFVTVLASGLSNTQFEATLDALDTPIPITDTGVANLNWNAIAFTSGADWIAIGNIEIQAFAGDAVQINDAIVSAFRQVIMMYCAQGFNDSPTSGDAGTSLNFDTCYALDNYKAGYCVSALAYTSFNNCAADKNGVAYYLHGAECVSFNGSGSEVQAYRNDAYPGYSYYFHGAKSCALNSPFSACGPKSDPRSTHLVFDDAATRIFVNSFKASAQGTPIPPTNVFTIDKTCSDITIWEPDFSVSGPTAWTDSGVNDTIYFAGQFHTPIKGTAGTNISGNAASGTSAALPTLNFANSAHLTPGEVSLSPGWGDTASVSVAGSFAMGSLQVTASGAGLSANPTVIFTFPTNEAGKKVPNFVWSRSDGTIAQTGYWLIFSITNTDITWIFVGTPATGQTIGIQWIASSMG